MLKYPLILACLLGFHTEHSEASTYSFLQNTKRALQLEIQYVREFPAAYYLVIDLPSRKVYLKSNAHLLRVCTIQKTTGVLPSNIHQLTFQQRIDPFTPEPGNANLRLRNRLIPLDFYGRLVEGSRQRSRLYFTPSLFFQSSAISPTTLPAIWLDAADIKALGAALKPGNIAILIPDELPIEMCP
jgi:hypothetical protein